jgi:hypothetical protein
LNIFDTGQVHDISRKLKLPSKSGNITKFPK